MKSFIYDLFVLLILLLIWYVSRRFAWTFGVRTLWVFVALLLLFMVCGIVSMGFISPDTDNIPGHVAAIICPNVIAVLMTLVFSMAIVDLANLGLHLKPATFAAVVIALTGILSAAGIINAYLPAVKHVNIETGKGGSTVRIAHLTDMHLGHNHGPEHVRKIVEKVKREKPDMVVITGDLFDSYYRRDARTIAAFRDIDVPVFFVDGNHDGYVNTAEVKSIVASLGNVKVLENEISDTCGIQLVGLNYMSEDEKNDGGGMGRRTSGQGETVRSVMEELSAELDPSKRIVVLHHVPCGAQYIEKAGADLFLSGHTHGGQFYPLIWFNDHNFEYNRGLYRLGNLNIYVSCGTGATGPQFRLGTRPEIAIIDLQ